MYVQYKHFFSFSYLIQKKKKKAQHINNATYRNGIHTNFTVLVLERAKQMQWGTITVAIRAMDLACMVRVHKAQSQYTLERVEETTPRHVARRHELLAEWRAAKTIFLYAGHIVKSF